MTLDLSRITQIVETSSTYEVNSFLNSGWRIIDTYSTLVSSETDDKVIMFILGKMDKDMK